MKKEPVPAEGKIVYLPYLIRQKEEGGSEMATPIQSNRAPLDVTQIKSGEKINESS